MFSYQGSRHTFFQQLRPEALGLMIVEQNVAFVEPTRNSEGILFPVDVPRVNYSRLGKGSECYREWDTVDGIIDHFVQVQDSDRVRSCLAFHLNSYDLVAGAEESELCG